MKRKLVDTLERITWTGISAILGLITTDVVTDLVTEIPDEYEGVVTVIIIAIVNGLTIIARRKVGVLPNPGEGLPGLKQKPETFNQPPQP